MHLPPKLCPECGEEYVHTMTMCGHCDVALVVDGELESAPDPGMEPASELVRIKTASASWAVRLSDKLREAGVAHRIEEDPDDGSERMPGHARSWGVFVREADRAAAVAIDAEHLREEIPDLPEDLADLAPEGEGCPACGEPLATDALECPGCGLPFGSVE